MCGVIVLLANGVGDVSHEREAIEAACKQMAPRGPDAQGIWQGEGVTLGHRRLAILDLDARAHQPMFSACGRYVIVFNGEIYNFRELRRSLEAEGTAFHTSSDTEVLLALFAREDEAMLPKLHGMFAFVIWDRVARRGFAARDPYGIKPLYVAQIANGVLLGSQVKALLATGLVSREPNPKGQAGFWMLGSVPEPHTWFRDVQALRAGHFVWIGKGILGEQCCWHDIGSAWSNAEGESLQTLAATREGVQQALRESVRRHLVSDVPVGVFLSGGIDSGSLAGLMLEGGAAELHAVTLAYDEFSGRPEDEAPAAREMAAHYGIRHVVRRVTRKEFLTDLSRILAAMDQPSIDGINTWYASKAVAELGLKVVVSGVGGDELFQGYSHFQSLPRLLAWRRATAWMPGLSALLCSAGRWRAARTGNERWQYLETWTRTIEGAWWLRRSVHTPDQLPELMGEDLAYEALKDFDVVAQVRAMTGRLPSDPALALGQIESSTYLRNQLLRDSDWASMDHSVELRTPLVDAHLLGQLQSLLAGFSRLTNKSLLANAPIPPLPKVISTRRKMGFGIPVAEWLTGYAQPLGSVWAPRVSAACYGTAS